MKKPIILGKPENTSLEKFATSCGQVNHCVTRRRLKKEKSVFFCVEKIDIQALIVW